MMKKQGKKNVCLRHEGTQVSVKRKGDLCKWNTTSFKSLITEFLLLQDYISSYSAVNIQMLSFHKLWDVFMAVIVYVQRKAIFSSKPLMSRVFFSSLPLLALPDLMHTVWHFVSLSLRCWLMLFPCSPWKKSVLI